MNVYEIVTSLDEVIIIEATSYDADADGGQWIFFVGNGAWIWKFHEIKSVRLAGVVVRT